MIAKAELRGFEMLCIHDSFWTHPNYADQLSEMYRECLVQINEEQVFQSICKQLNPRMRVIPTKLKVARMFAKYASDYALS